MLTNSKEDTPGNMYQAGIACQRGDAWVTLYTFNYQRARLAVKMSRDSIKTELGWIKRTRLGYLREKKESGCCFSVVCMNAGSVVLYLKTAHRSSGCNEGNNLNDLIFNIFFHANYAKSPALISHVSEISFVAPPNEGVHMCPRTTASKIPPPPR